MLFSALLHRPRPTRRRATPLTAPFPAAFVAAILAAILAAFLLAACDANTRRGAITPVASPADTKAYRFIELDNRMKVLLVSDPAAEKAAASLDIYVGSAGNPPDRGGLAHFLEHMLFLGTDKYPDPGEYARFISEHGGSRNAYTGFEHTNYFFDIDQAYLAPALDRFGQFFISPRFDSEYVERETNAVHAEYQMGLKVDAMRNLDVLRELVNSEHPFSVLGVGTSDTLAERPGSSVREELLDFYERYYSANLMALAVLGRDDLDELESMVRGIFSAVPDRGVEVPDIEAPLYSPDSLPMLVHIRPEASQRQLELSFPMPNYESLYRAQPVRYIANLIGHEGEGSLLSSLKAEGWAESLVAGPGLSWRGGAAFSVRMSLTEAGMNAREQVLARFFEYIAMLEREEPSEALYREQGLLAALDFRFRPDTQPMRQVVRLTNDMQRFEPEDVLRGDYMLEDYRPDLIAEIVSRYIQPDNVVVSVIDKDVPVDRESRYYATPYSARTLGPGEGLAWRGEAPDSGAMRLPEPNTFVAENLDLVTVAGDNPPTPRLVKDADGMRLWFRQDDKFRAPRGVLQANFRSALASDTPAHAAAARLYVALLRDTINEFAYPARLAGLDFSIGADARGISLSVSGYNDKQLTLLDSIVDVAVNTRFDPRRFADVRAELIRELDNTRTAPAFRQVMGKVWQLLLSGHWDEQELIAELETMTPAQVVDYADRFWAGAEVYILLNGNYRQETVAEVQESLRPLTSLRREVLPSKLEMVRIGGGRDSVYRAEVEHEDAVLFWYMQGEDDSLEQRAMTALTAQIVSAGYFDELRTEQQLGYVVSAFNLPLFGVPGLMFMVQSPVAGADRIHASTLEFLEGVRDSETLAEGGFERHRAALLTRLLTPFKNIDEQSGHFWRDITEGHWDFDSREKIAELIRGISLEDWRAWFERNLFEQRTSLLVASPGAEGALPPGRPVPDRAAFKAAHDIYIR